jgi:hypothetical protein
MSRYGNVYRRTIAQIFELPTEIWFQFSISDWIWGHFRLKFSATEILCYYYVYWRNNNRANNKCNVSYIASRCQFPPDDEFNSKAISECLGLPSARHHISRTISFQTRPSNAPFVMASLMNDLPVGIQNPCLHPIDSSWCISLQSMSSWRLPTQLVLWLDMV